MKCFHHPQVDAVAICKNCHKGLCADCAADLGNGVACKGRCEAEVAALSDLQQRNKTAYLKAANAYNKQAILMAGFGSLAALVGLLAGPSEAGLAALIVGGLFFLGAWLYYTTARRYKSPN